MRGDPGGRIEEPLQRGLPGRHARIVQDEAIGPAVAATLAAIGRGKKPSGERTVGKTRVRHEDGLAGDRKDVSRASLATGALYSDSLTKLPCRPAPPWKRANPASVSPLATVAS